MAFAKILKYHISKYTKTSLGNFESDAEACFDRIVMAFALICSGVWGAPRNILTTWGKVLKTTEHKVKTGYGISRNSYKSTESSPIIGPGQGSRGAPAACATMTIPLLRTLDKLSTGAHFTFPDKTIRYKAMAKMYIDDNTTYSNHFNEWIKRKPTAEEVGNITAKDAQTWEICLWTSGGSLKLHKCKYYIMHWKFDGKGKAMLTPATELPNITLTVGDSNNIMQIQQLDCTEEHETLGNWLPPSIIGDKALDIIRNKTETYAKRISTSSLNRYEAWIG